MNTRQVQLGQENRAAIKALMATHLGISRKEVSERLGLSPMAVTRHVAAIRAEWGGDTLPTRRSSKCTGKQR